MPDFILQIYRKTKEYQNLLETQCVSVKMLCSLDNFFFLNNYNKYIDVSGLLFNVCINLVLNKRSSTKAVLLLG